MKSSSSAGKNSILRFLRSLRFCSRHCSLHTATQPHSSPSNKSTTPAIKLPRHPNLPLQQPQQCTSSPPPSSSSSPPPKPSRPLLPSHSPTSKSAGQQGNQTHAIHPPTTHPYTTNTSITGLNPRPPQPPLCLSLLAPRVQTLRIV